MAKKNKPNGKPKTAGVSTLRTVGMAAIGICAGLVGVLLARKRPDTAEHAAPDLAVDRARPGADSRAPVAFRPDPTAPVPASELEGLRPATGPNPSSTAPRGEIASQTGGSNG